VVHQAENVIQVPGDLPLEAVVSVELAMCVGTVFLMLKDMNGLDGRVVAINGLGPAGMVAAQMARAEGAREVIGFDLLPDRRENALRIGLDRFMIRPTTPLPGDRASWALKRQSTASELKNQSNSSWI
jgi:threonine dehydrogenase-like Zn-dependent dehydrogenase